MFYNSNTFLKLDKINLSDAFYCNNCITSETFLGMTDSEKGFKVVAL